jgi:hypothetical protein
MERAVAGKRTRRRSNVISKALSSWRRRRHVRQPPNAERSSAGSHSGNDLFRDYPEQASVT